MAQNTKTSFPKWIHYFDILDSTNNYAMGMIDDGMTHHGHVVWAKQQTKGKGQRGKQWDDNDKNIKMSLIVKPLMQPSNTFHLSMITCLLITHYLKSILDQSCQIAIKWPNDIYINDKKACGILIENSFRGMNWNDAIIGIGLNVGQVDFNNDLVGRSTSLVKENGGTYDQLEIITEIRSGILNTLLKYPGNLNWIKEEYHSHLYKINEISEFKNLKTEEIFKAKIMGVSEQGQLILHVNNENIHFDFGTLKWLF